uniref:Uncharacterized protein n=1 Tax=viral metagenome TaxID=1070528 RepID=A0A6C0E3H5_9ZZZZ
MLINNNSCIDRKKITMVFLLSFLFGCLIKTYDEIIDNKLNCSVFFIESIKIFMIGIITILFLYENSFIIPFLFGLCYNLYLGDLILIKFNNTPIEDTAINDPYWNNSIIYVTVLAVFIFFYNYSQYFLTFRSFWEFLLSKNKYIISAIYIAFTFFSYLWESYYFTEENSSKKYYWRIIFVFYSIITCVLFIVYKDYFVVGLSMLKLWHIGYLSVWFIFKFFIRKENVVIKESHIDVEEYDQKTKNMKKHKQKHKQKHKHKIRKRNQKDGNGILNNISK